MQQEENSQQKAQCSQAAEQHINAENLTRGSKVEISQ
jgi:hypothetical protein